jgi:hypothetical protein
MLEFSDVLKLGNDVDQLQLAYRREEVEITKVPRNAVPQVQVTVPQVQVAE